MTNQDIREYKKQYYQKNKEKYLKERRKYQIEFYKEFPWIKHLYSARRRCKHNKRYVKRNIKCYLSIEQTKKLWFRDKAYLLDRPSIDRKDGGISHYTYDNCRFIEWEANCFHIGSYVCPKCGYRGYRGKIE